MKLQDLLKTKRSIRKFKNVKIEKDKLEKIVEAGLYAPSAGGRQETKIIVIEDENLIKKIGIQNANCENRNWHGQGVNSEQPSIIDDLNIVNGFYDCQALAIVCIPKEKYNKVNAIGSGFVCLQNMALSAYDLGIDSCIVGRAEATFNIPEMALLLKKWKIDDNYMPLMFLCLGYINGHYPTAKKRKENRVYWIND